MTTDKPTAEKPTPEKSDPVNHPLHYTHPSGRECIEFARHLNFNLGNAFKYLWRAGRKGDAIEDLRKALWYLDDELKARAHAPEPRKNYNETALYDMRPEETLQHFMPNIATALYHILRAHLVTDPYPTANIRVAMLFIKNEIARRHPAPVHIHSQRVRHMGVGTITDLDGNPVDPPPRFKGAPILETRHRTHNGILTVTIAHEGAPAEDAPDTIPPQPYGKSGLFFSRCPTIRDAKAPNRQEKE